MCTYLLRIIIFILFLLPFEVYSSRVDPSVCDCKSMQISTEEQENGCPADVKWEKCPKFRDAVRGESEILNWRRLKRLEDSMNPGRAGVKLNR